MKTIKICLLFLLMPFISFGQEECSDGQIQIYIELWSIGGTGVGKIHYKFQLLPEQIILQLILMVFHPMNITHV